MRETEREIRSAETLSYEYKTEELQSQVLWGVFRVGACVHEDDK